MLLLNFGALSYALKVLTSLFPVYYEVSWRSVKAYCTRMKFSIRHLLDKLLMENFIFCVFAELKPLKLPESSK